MAKSDPKAIDSGEPKAPKVQNTKPPARVVVASKLPVHVELQLCRPMTRAVAGQFGSTEETVMVKHGPRHVIRGTGHPNGTVPKGFPRAPHVNDAGFALTHDVPGDFWAAWLEQNKDTDLVRNGLLHAAPSMADVLAMTRPHEKVDSGIGPLDPDGDARNPKPLGSSVSPIEKDTAAAA